MKQARISGPTSTAQGVAIHAALALCVFVAGGCEGDRRSRRAAGPYGPGYGPGYGYQQPGYGYPPGYAPYGYPYGYGPPQPPPQQPPPQQPPMMPPPVSTEQPPGPTPAPTVAPTPPPAPVDNPEYDKCMAPDGRAADCRVALQKMTLSPQPVGRYFETYKHACAIKTKLLGCGAYKTSQSMDADRPVMEALIACEVGKPEACEGLTPSTAGLTAWHSTLKKEWCKKGESALCEDYKQCKRPAVFGCESTGASGATACGCVPKCAAGLKVEPTGTKWPDGSQRAKITCQ